MKKMKKPMLMLVSAVFILATVLAGCSNSNSGGNEPKSTATNAPTTGTNANAETEPPSDVWQVGSEPLEFSIFAHYAWQDFPEWDSVPVGKWVKENKKVNIKTMPSGGNNAQLLSTMIVDDKLPDVLWGDRNHPDFERLREAGKLVALDPYLDKYPNLKKWMGEESLDLLRAEDGKLYQFPNWYTNKPTGSAGYVINRKIYEELGKPKLETTDDLYAYLLLVKEKYKDVVPLEVDRAQDAQGLGVIYTGFGEGTLYNSLNNSVQSVVKDGKLTSVFVDPVFREAQKYISKLYREKLITQDAFTQTEIEVVEKLSQGRVAVYAGGNVMKKVNAAQLELQKKDPTAAYDLIWPIHKPGLNKDKIFTSTYNRLGWNVNVITTKAKDPEKIFAFLDWYTSPEGMSIQYFGPEGGNWKGFDEDGNPIFTDTFNPAEVAKLQADNEIYMINGNSSFIDPAKVKQDNTMPDAEKNWLTKWQNAVTWPTSYDATAWNDLDPLPDTDLGNTRQSVVDLFLQVYAASSTAKSDEEVDKLLDKAEADAQKLGYGKLLEFRTEKWIANKKTLGIE